MSTGSSSEETRAWLPQMSARRAWLWLLGALIVAAALFAQAIDFSIIPTWDDGVYVAERPEVKDWWSASWRQRLITPEIGYPLPLPTFIYAHVHGWFGDSALRMLHLLSLGLHLVNSVLVFRLVGGWFGRRAGLIVASLWSIQPVVVESVVWMTNLKTVLAATFMLAAMVVFEGLRREADAAQKRRGAYLAIGVCFIAALGCRPDAAILPVLLAAQCLLSDDVIEPLRAHAALLAPLTVAGALYAALADTGHAQITERSVFFEEGLADLVVRLFHALEIATKNLAWPTDLHPAYFQEAGEGFEAAVVGLVILGALVALLVALLVRGRRRLAFPIVLAAILYAPFSNLVFCRGLRRTPTCIWSASRR